ncbi:MAG TPA: hypothetical protein VNI53_10645 [Gammaproteobacteria bacterium]|nr:hypothetical protein [Gammaproteobacteria bacterium]
MNTEVVLDNDRFKELIENILTRQASPSHRGRTLKKIEKPCEVLE